MSASDKSPSQHRSGSTVPASTEEEVLAAVKAYREGTAGEVQPDFEQLLLWMRRGLIDDMRRALHAAATVRAVAGAKDSATGSLPDLPRSWHVTRAIVTAAEATAEDPEAMRTGARSRGRFYAGAALHRVFPATTINGCLALCGGGPQANIRLRSAMRTDWWRKDVIDQVALAVRAEPEPAEASSTMSLPRPAVGLASTLVSANWLRASSLDPVRDAPVGAVTPPAADTAGPIPAGPQRAIAVECPPPVLHISPLARIIDRRPSGPLTHALMGDPQPGRSALDQRRARQALATAGTP